MIKVIWFVITALVQIAVVLALYWASSLVLYYYVTPYMPGYYEDSALADTQAILLSLLLWDRFFGPSSKMLRDVAKILYAAKREQEED